MTLQIAPQVDYDLDEIVTYIAAASEMHGDRLLQKIYAEIEHIARSPQLYRVRPEVGRNARVAIVGQYLILFRVVGSLVRVERVVHGSRSLPSLFQDALQNG